MNQTINSINQPPESNQLPESVSLLEGPCPPDVAVRFVQKPYPLDESAIDADALKVVRRLLRFGHETYLVGGCVRDILLGSVPKDFDVATSARPAEIKALFRNCRLIGRRFRLAHLHFKDQKIIEVATFRREPLDTDDLTLRHAAQNLFGTAADDAVRRDFTINALMYDVEKGAILDWVGGLDDIDKRVIRAIGAPERRLPEDPVRIIRAAKFAAKLNLDIEEVLFEQMKLFAPLISECSQARLIEELFKILRSGYASSCLSRLESVKGLAFILPGFHHALSQMEDQQWLLMAKVDEAIQNGRSFSDSFLLAAFLYPVMESMIWDATDVAKAVSVALKTFVHPLQFTKKHMAMVRHAFVAQRRMVKGPKNKRSRRLAERDFMADALDLLEMTGKTSSAVVEHWRKLLHRQHAHPPVAAPKPRPKRKRPPVRRTRTPKIISEVSSE